MTGVDILATKEVAVTFAFNWTCFWIVLAAGGVIGLFISIYGVVQNGNPWWSIPLFMVLLATFSGAVGVPLGKALGVPIEYETQYKVTISDAVTMSDFLEKYEIVDVDGKIYTVRER